VDPSDGLDTVMKGKIPSPRRESNPRTVAHLSIVRAVGHTSR